MIFDTLPWSNVVPTRSYFTNKWINEKFKNWSMNSRSSHVLILWKFNIEVKPFTSPGPIIKRSCKVMDIWSPVDTEVSYKSWEVSCLKSALNEVTQSCKEKKWDNHQRSSHPSPRKIQHEVAWNLEIWGSLNVKLVRSDQVKKSVLTCHWMKCTLTFMVLKYEVSHAGLFLQTEVISYLDIQEVVIVDTIPEVCSASTNPVIDVLRSQTYCNQKHRILKFQGNGKSFSLLPFSFCLVEVLVEVLLKFFNHQVHAKKCEVDCTTRRHAEVDHEDRMWEAPLLHTLHGIEVSFIEVHIAHAHTEVQVRLCQEVLLQWHWDVVEVDEPESQWYSEVDTALQVCRWAPMRTNEVLLDSSPLMQEVEGTSSQSSCP